MKAIDRDRDRCRDLGEAQQQQIRLSLRFDYRGFDRFRLEFQAGYDWTTRDVGTVDDIKMTGLYFHVGYRTLF